jgi:hypothetical protein
MIDIQIMNTIVGGSIRIKIKTGERRNEGMKRLKVRKLP